MGEKHDNASSNDVQPRLLLHENSADSSTTLSLPHCLVHTARRQRQSLRERGSNAELNLRLSCCMGEWFCLISVSILTASRVFI